MTHDKNITLDLSVIFNETGYINKNDRDKYSYNNYITHITLTQSINSSVKIGDDFLRNYCNLISIDTKLINVFAIGNHFCGYCSKLTVFDTTELISLKTIGNHFLYNCYSLTTFDTIGLISLATIGDYFLCCCKLKVFDATKLTSLITIGKCFLYGCNKLKVFDATKLTSLTIIGDYFLYDCDENLRIIVKNPSNCLYERLSLLNYKIIQLYDKPCIYLGNDCVI